MKKGYRTILTVVVVVLVAIVGAAVAFAQGAPTDEAPAAGTEQAIPFGGRHGFGMRPERGMMQDIVDPEAMHAALADALGLTVDELDAAHAEGKRLPEIAEEQGVAIEDVQAAMQAAWETAVNDALAAGTITQEQADMLIAHGGRFAMGSMGGRGGDGMRGDMGLMQTIFDRDAVKAVIAETLGMTVEELDAAHADGQRLPEIADAQGVTMDEIQTAVEAARTAAIEDALAAGTITQEQADMLLSHPWQPGGPHGGHHGGPRNGFGNPQGQFGGNGAGFQQFTPQGADQNA